MITVREFNSAEDLIRHAAEVRQRLRAVRGKPVTPLLHKGVRLYPGPIGPVRVVARDVIDLRRPARHIEIIREVCEKYHVTKDEIEGFRRHQHLVRAKRELCFRLRRETTMSFPRIGQIIGKDHTTVLYNFYKHLEANPDLILPSDVAQLEQWKLSNAKNTERNKDYWTRCRLERESKRRAARTNAKKTAVLV